MRGVSRRGLTASIVAGTVVSAIVLACSSDSPNDTEQIGKTREALTSALTATGDTYLRQGSPNQNEGTETILRLQSSGKNRALVRFDAASVTSLTPGTTATVKLTIASTGDNWGTSGRPIAIHRVTTDWTELGATWNCAVDTDTSNSSADCSGATAWDMYDVQHPELEPFVQTPTATATITTNETGVVTFDVSADVALFHSGTPNYGWIVKKVVEGDPGLVEFASRETSTPPLLVGTCDDPTDSGTCSTTDAGDAGDAEAAADASDAQEEDAGPVCVPADCNAGGDTCTQHTCTSTGCVSTPLADGTACSDDNACTTGDRCIAGTCTPGGTVSVDDGNPCTVDSCDPLLGVTHTPVAAGTSCSNGNACDGLETCSASAVCQAGTPPVLDDGNPCTIDACDPAVGVTHTPAAAGTACSDGNACDGLETCDGVGACVAGVPPLCNSGSACIIDGCDPAIGCTQTPAPVGVSCSDGDACDGTETCDGAGACAPGTPLSCTTNNVCLTASCDPTAGCTTTPKPVGTSCSDNNACNGLETCDATAICQPGAPLVLDDGNICTADACDPTLGVTHTPVPNCNPTPVFGDAPFETRASIIGQLVSNTGAAIVGATFTVYDDRAAGTPRSDVVSSVASDGSFRLKLTSFPNAEPDRTPPHRVVLVIDSPSTIRAFRVGYAHPGDTISLGTIRLVGRDPNVTNIGPEGGTATDSQGLVSVVIPPGALTTTVPIQITPYQNRQDFAAPLPDSTLTMYGVELEPTGTTFTTPVTIRFTNYLNLPTTLQIPVGRFDTVEGRWEHESVATWDGAKFAGTVSHFCPVDANGSPAGDLVLITTNPIDPNKGKPDCGKGSSWRANGGGMQNVFALPSTRVRGEDVGFSLQYDSGLAGSRKLGGGTTTTAQTVPRGSLSVSVGASMKTVCVPHGAGSSAFDLQPGDCTTAVGSCGAGSTGGGLALSMLGANIQQQVSTVSNSQEVNFGGWIDVPQNDAGGIASTGFITAHATLMMGAAKECMGNGGVFGVADSNAPRFPLTTTDPAPWASFDHKVFFHHRFSSPFGAGWALREVSRLFVSGDQAVLVDGDGQEEQFQPRPRLTDLGILGQHMYGRDPVTGELFAASLSSIDRVDPVTGALTPLISGVSYPRNGTFFTVLHGMAVAYVGGARHFVVAHELGVEDFDSTGADRSLRTRNITIGNDIFTQASLAAQGDSVFYTEGDDSNPVLFHASLSDASPALVPLTLATNGDKRLYPTAPLSGVQFGGPRGMAFAADGSLYVADARRHTIYVVHPGSGGFVDGSSVVEVAFGDAGGRFMTAPGERVAGPIIPVHAPLRVAVSEDGYVFVQARSSFVRFDPLAREAELLFVNAPTQPIKDRSNELTIDLEGNGVPSSILPVSATSMFVNGNAFDVRIDMDMLSSERDPMRTITRLAGGGFQITDPMQALTFIYDGVGRLATQQKRTGETDFTVQYTDAQSDRIDSITNAVGGAWRFAYANNKIASITDPAGGTTTLTVDGQGDLSGFVEPDGESHTFVYDAHHMTSKTAPSGDVTTYTFNADGTIASSTKPGGEHYTFETVDATPPGYDANGLLVHSGGYTDARGVHHALVVNERGDLEKDTFVADGVTRVLAAVHPATLVSTRHEAFNSGRFNSLHRTSQWTMNGVPLSPAMVFDSLGRPSFQSGPAGSVIHDSIYASDGWLLQDYLGTSQDSLRYVRDGAGHVVKLQHVSRGSFGPTDANAPPTGLETDFTWRADGLPATMTTHGVTTTFTYDPVALNVIQATDTVGRTVSLGYDARGNVTSSSDGTASASFVFDANNRLTQSVDGFSNATTLRYTRQDCGCSEKDEVTGIHTPDLPDGVEWTMTYGPQGRLATVTDPHGFSESYTYETTGELKSVLDRLSRTTTMSHDQLGRLLGTVDTAGRTHQRSYTVPVSGAWNGPTLTAASADGTAATTSLSSALRSGDYQIGFNAYPIDGFPAPISLYRDATVAIAYQRTFDDVKRLTKRVDRVGAPIDSAVLNSGNFVPTVDNELYSYDPHTNTPLLDFFSTQRRSGSATSTVTRNVELDTMTTTGFGQGLEDPATYAYTRDAAGRLTAQSTRFSSSGLSGIGPTLLLVTYGAHYTYYNDGRLSSVTNADGAMAVSSGGAPVITEGPHSFTYDARGQLATQSDFDGTYLYRYDALGRNTRLDFPDGHARVQVFDDLGRITSRCYEYPDSALNRCYTAQYDPVGNPVVLTDPEGSDSLDYDSLDRLSRVTRLAGGATLAVEDYAYNGLGALSVNAGVTMDHQRPRLDGGGLADAPVPNTLGGQPVTLDPGGRITSLKGVPFSWDLSGTLFRVGDSFLGVDTYNRRVWNVSNAGPNEFYLNEGANRIAIVTPSAAVPQGFVNASFLYEGIDHPLRIASWSTQTIGTPPTVITTRAPVVFGYYEIDLAGNVRRLRAPGGADLGGYRYSAFGQTVEDTVINAAPPTVSYDLTTQPLRWKGRPRDVFGAVQAYDMRAREWVPEAGVFLAIDEYEFQDEASTLWGWPNQNPGLADPLGRGWLGAAVGGAVGTYIGVSVGTILGQGVGGIATVETGPGTLAGVATGGVVGGALGGTVGAAFGAKVGSDIEDSIAAALAGALEATRKGERGTTAKPTGTDNPDKHLIWDPVSQRWFIRDPHTGKRKFKPRGYRPPPPGFFPLSRDDDDDDDEANACE